ncbi:MAG: membrane dipeptidase [Proteobacteria bacterium]|nr:membrane dipeptidase [Pseudomonadota bacterium]
MVSRRKVLAGFAVGIAAAGTGAYFKFKPEPVEIGFKLTEDELAAAHRFLQAYPVIDCHAHPGRSFVRDAQNLAWKMKLYSLAGTFEETTVADMRVGGVAAAVFNGVADFQLLDLAGGAPGAVREFEGDEGWDSYRRQIQNLKQLEADGLIVIARTAADVHGAHAAGTPAAFLGMEGADFLGDDMSRLQAVYDDGLRMITLVHYHNNTLGDITTGSPGKRGLTEFGREVVVGMNKLGIVIDIAHASEQTAFDALAVSTRPVVLSHTHINSPVYSHPRFVSVELAAAVADSGGYVGAWPAGLGIDTLAGFVDRIEELVEVLGEDHVALGSDMDANYKPVLDTYRKMPLVIGALMKRGYSDEIIAKFTSGNFLRVMSEVQNV